MIDDSGRNCTRCGEFKSWDAFGTYRAGTRGRNSVCKPCAAARVKEYRASNPAYVAGQAEKRKATNKGRPAPLPGNASARWRAAHPEVAKARKDAYRASPEGKAANRLQAARRRARIRGNPMEPYTPADLHAMLEELDHRCVYCAIPLVDGIEWDHVHPIALGGADALWNLRPACPPCNRSKGAKLLADWLPLRSTPEPS